MSWTELAAPRSYANIFVFRATAKIRVVFCTPKLQSTVHGNHQVPESFGVTVLISRDSSLSLAPFFETKARDKVSNLGRVFT